MSTGKYRQGLPGQQVLALQVALVLEGANTTSANCGTAKRSKAKCGGRSGRKTQHPRSTDETGEVFPRRPGEGKEKPQGGA